MVSRTFKLTKPPAYLKKCYPLTAEDLEFIRRSQQQISSILCGNDPRILIITGPCSIHNEESALEYASRLNQLQEKVKSNIFLVMRVYFEKPRTKTGWKGILYDPNLDDSENLEQGIEITRRIMTKITHFEVPIASEIVDPLGFYFFNDLISWLCIGARTTSSQVHRQNTSGMSMPVGYKNDPSGNFTNAINGIVSSDSAHTFLGINDEGRVGIFKSVGSPFAHLVLRGAKDKPNYFPDDIKRVVKELEAVGLFPCLVIDCSHDNCYKNFEKMPDAFRDVINQIKAGNNCIRGLMLESNLLPGTQPIDKDISKIDPRISITDPCIGWDTTEELIMWAHQQLG